LIKFRWFVAGGGATIPFSNEALDEIFKVTLGLPREIVKVCDLALIHTYSQQRQKVERNDVVSAAKELKIQQKY
jgi:type II secretory pathway predicted ATPase ExeA